MLEVEPLRSDSVMRVELHDEISALIKKNPQSSLLLLPHLGTWGERPSMNQEGGPQQALNILTP